MLKRTRVSFWAGRAGLAQWPRRLAKTLGASSISPISGLSRMMSERNDNQFFSTFDNNDVVGEAAKNKAFCSFGAGMYRHGGQRNETVFYNIESSINRLGKLGTQPISLFFVPTSRRFRFLGCLPENSYFSHYPDSSFLRILRRNSARSTNSACPASISPIRREISRSQASSTPLSRGSSRLRIRSCANSARSASESASISERRRCRGSVAIAAPNIYSVAILSSSGVPNNGFNRTPISFAAAKPGERSCGLG